MVKNDPPEITDVTFMHIYLNKTLTEDEKRELGDVVWKWLESKSIKPFGVEVN